jgi:hypothetical protein
LAFAAAVSSHSNKSDRLASAISQSKNEAKRSRQITDTAEALLEDLKGRMAKYVETFQTSHEKIMDDTGSNLSTFLEHQNTIVVDFIRAREKEFDDFRTRLELHIKTEAPTSYWNDKAQSHGRTAIIFGIIFAGVLFGGIYALFAHGVSFVSYATSEITGTQNNSGLVGLIPLVFISVPVLATAWALRHISRIIIQSLALQADAELVFTAEPKIDGLSM